MVPRQKVGGLGYYDEACRAVAAAKDVDEAKDIHDKADALRVYARQANNLELEIAAAAIRIRAERQIGVILIAQKETAGLAKGGQSYRPTRSDAEQVELIPTLNELGISRKLSMRAQKLGELSDEKFETMLDAWHERLGETSARVTVNLLKSDTQADKTRAVNDFYPTPHSIVAEVCARWRPSSGRIWEPFDGDGRFAAALETIGHETVRGDIAKGQDFFDFKTAPAPTICSNPPFDRVREIIDRAFEIGIEEMCLVLPERLWACLVGSEQFERHKPAIWANMSWREDYLGRGGSADRALAVAIWDCPNARACSYEIWSRQN